MGEIVDSNVNGFNGYKLKTDKDIDIGFSESNTNCYRQYIGFTRSDPCGHAHPLRNWK